MGAPAWGTRVAAGIAAALVIGVSAALALPVATGGGSPSVSVDEVPDTSHAALVKEYEQKVAERRADIAAAAEHQARLQKEAQEARAAEEEAKTAQEKAEADAKAQAEKEAEAEADAKAEEDAAAKAKDDSAKDATDSKESTATKGKETEDKLATPDWWPEHVWAHATVCTLAEDGQSVVGTWDVWVKYGGDWTVVSASDDPAEVSGTDGDKVKVVYTDRTATFHKEHDGMAKYLGGPVHITVANAADSSQAHTFKVDLWVVAKDDGTCPA